MDQQRQLFERKFLGFKQVGMFSSENEFISSCPTVQQTRIIAFMKKRTFSSEFLSRGLMIYILVYCSGELFVRTYLDK